MLDEEGATTAPSAQPTSATASNAPESVQAKRARLAHGLSASQEAGGSSKQANDPERTRRIVIGLALSVVAVVAVVALVMWLAADISL